MLEAILYALTQFIIEVIITLLLVSLAAIVDWFLGISNTIDEEDLAFTLKQDLNNGEFTIVQGLFDQSTGKVETARRINGKQLDPKLAQAHNRDRLVLYT